MASIYKKVGSPYYWVCYRVDGKKYDKSLKVRSKEIAIRLRNRLEESIALGQAGLLAHKDKAIDDFVPVFNEYITRRNNPGTLDRYSRSVKIFTNYLNKDYTNIKLLSAIRRFHIEHYITYRRQKVNIKTVNNEVRAINRFLNVAKELNYIGTNPVDGMKGIKELEKPPSYYSEDEIILMLNKAEGKTKVMIILLLQTGIRKGEINNLEWPDIDFINRSISINIKDDWAPKDRTFRKIPLYRESFEALIGLKSEERGYVFGKPDRHLDRTFKRFLDIIGVKGSIKKFRDTYASYSLACGMPLQNLKDNLGHLDIRTTQIYLQAVPRIKNEEIKRLFNGWK